MLADRFPGVPRIALTATADPQTPRGYPPRACSWKRRALFLASFDRPNIRYAIALKQRSAPAAARLHPRRASRRERHRLLPEPRPRSRRRPTGCAARRSRPCPITPGSTRRCARRNQDGLPQGRRAGARGDHRLRHGDRQARRALRRPSRPARQHRGLLPGDGPCRTRRAAGRDAWMLYGMQDVVLRRRMIDEAGAGRGEADRAAKLEALLGSARRRAAAARRCSSHFGEAMAEPCGNCDGCLAPAEILGRHGAAQKALSAILRTGAAFRRRRISSMCCGAPRPRRSRASAMTSCRPSASARSRPQGLELGLPPAGGAGRARGRP